MLGRVIGRYLVPVLILGALAVWGGTACYAYRLGVFVTEARAEKARQKVQEDLYKLGARIGQLAGALEAARAEQVPLALELEDAARQDPDNSPGLSAERVQRLHRRWRAP